MSDDDASIDNLEIDSKTWNQIEKNLKQHGFREGASAGQEAAYQSGFDKGYREGFGTGKALGFAKGLLDCTNSLFPSKSLNVSMDARLENPSKGSCIVCAGEKLDRDFYSLPLDEIIAEQKDKRVEILRHIDGLKIQFRNENG